MNSINDIDVLIKKQKTELVIYNYFLSNDVLEHYVNNTKFINWEAISHQQPLSNTFIIKYFGKLKWWMVLNNNRAEVTYDLLIELLYEYNLYETILICKNNKTLECLNKIKDEYKTKYDVDKIYYELSK